MATSRIDVTLSFVIESEQLIGMLEVQEVSKYIERILTQERLLSVSPGAEVTEVRVTKLKFNQKCK